MTESVISDVRVTWERVSQKLNIVTARRRGPQVAMGYLGVWREFLSVLTSCLTFELRYLLIFPSV